MMRSALLFYMKFVKDLEGDGYIINPYDPCLTNKIVNGKQLIVAWHVDNLKGSHMKPSLIYQDNKSAILLETNCKASSSKCTKHI